jgi:hypothetical protein
MKMGNEIYKIVKQKLIGIIVGLVILLPYTSYGQYSIQNRWNIKVSVSWHKSNPWKTEYHPNFRAEANYSILNWVELGTYMGFMYHKAMKLDTMKIASNEELALAPTFGFNANFHLLPFFVKKTDCRWELYLTAKYGAAYLIKWVGYKDYAAFIAPLWYADDVNRARYRHEFGVGIGGGVYFLDVFGLYFEGMVGQYSYFIESFHSNFSLRTGIEFKFISKKTKAKQQEIGAEYRKL